MQTVSVHAVQYIEKNYDYMTLDEIGRLVINVLGAGWQLTNSNSEANLIITLNNQMGNVGFINSNCMIMNFPRIRRYDSSCELRSQLNRFRRLFFSKL